MTTAQDQQSRAEFEAFWRKEMNVEAMDLARTNYPMTPPEKQQYLCHETNRAWITWQAARTLPAPENVREGEPYDNPAFEDLARTMGVWGTAQAALCAQFFLAARALPAPVICYVRPGATLPRRMGWETCAATDAGALAVHADGRTLHTGTEPVAWTVAGEVTNWAKDFRKDKTQHYVRPVFTAAQVLAMGRVPPDWQAVPVKPTEEMRQAGYDAFGVDGCYQSMIAAAPRPPAAQEGA